MEGAEGQGAISKSRDLHLARGPSSHPRLTSFASTYTWSKIYRFKYRGKTSRLHLSYTLFLSSALVNAHDSPMYTIQLGSQIPPHWAIKLCRHDSRNNAAKETKYEREKWYR